MLQLFTNVFVCYNEITTKSTLYLIFGSSESEVRDPWRRSTVYAVGTLIMSTCHKR